LRIYLCASESALWVVRSQRLVRRQRSLHIRSAGCRKMLTMRRTLATLLIAVFGLVPSSSALFPSDAESNLPACCRVHGKHHCAMMANPPASSSGPVIQAGNCPFFPGSNAAVAHPITDIPKASQAVFSEVVSHPATHPQTEALYRISFSRADQKRGPPLFRS